MNEHDTRRCWALLSEWNARPVNSEPLAPLLLKDDETEAAFLVRAQAHYHARAVGLDALLVKDDDGQPTD